MSRAREEAMERARQKRQRRLERRRGPAAAPPAPSILAQIKQAGEAAAQTLGTAVRSATVAVLGGET